MMMKRLLPAAVALLLFSCAGTKSLTINTEPAGAEISINGKPVGTSNLTTEVSQEKNLGIVAYKPGYEVGAATLKTRTNWWLALLWTKNDPKAQVIDEDSVTIPLKRIPAVGSYAPAALPPYNPPTKRSEAPALRDMPSF
ncbi:MAG: PEGA domain-containing protein [Akkermansia sp.]